MGHVIKKALSVIALAGASILLTTGTASAATTTHATVVAPQDLESVVQPVLQAAQPLTSGIGDMAEGALQGAAGTVGQLPGRADQILQAIDNNQGLLGDLAHALLG